MSASRLEGPWSLPVQGPPVPELEAGLLELFAPVSAATACAKLHQMGIRKTHIKGVRSNLPGTRVIGRAVTLQFMPLREDIYEDAGATQEYVERSTALWAVLDAIEPNDVLVVQAGGTLQTGVVGEMLGRHLKNRGGLGVVADGGIRDMRPLQDLGLPIWSLGSTPHYASQGEVFPWGFHVPVAVGGVLVLPGDLIVADDDGAVVVPRGRAREVAEYSVKHEAWEEFSRLKLAEGGALTKYYPLDEEAEREYSVWQGSSAVPSNG